MLSRYVVSQVKHNSFFLVGLALGLWLALAAVPLDEEPAACAARAAQAPSAADEFEPEHEERPAAAAGAARAVQRPRYYSTELGLRAPLLTAVLSEEAALDTRVAALNLTAAHLQPALRFFMSARAAAAGAGPGAAAARANVVGFTDAREMLKPFHVLKYLADNYLDEYELFFLVSDASFVNARRVAALAARLSASQHVYMGAPAQGDDAHYCTLEGGILLSNSVLRAVQGELDWCVRNSYSPRHHENIGRCVLHAAHTACAGALQGETYAALALGEGALVPALADAVTAHPVTRAEDFYRLHAYVSRLYLERDAAEVALLRAQLRRLLPRHPPAQRAAAWPPGARADPGLAPPPPRTRFDHLRWTWFNATHALMPDDHRAAGALAGAHLQAVRMVERAALAWARRAWGADAALVEGAWRWEPAAALRYRLLLRVPAAAGASRYALRLVEAARALGAARLVPVPYVTESARVALLVPARAGDAARAHDALRRYEACCLRRADNTALTMVLLGAAGEEEPAWSAALRAAAAELRARYPARALDVLRAPAAPGDAARAALAAAGARLPRDALVLLAPPHAEFGEDALNRVRMNCIVGAAWALPLGFARFALYEHPRLRDAAGRPPASGTGRFNARRADTLAFYKRDYDDALARWAGGARGSAAEVLAAAPLRCVRAPEPALALRPAPAPDALDLAALDLRALDLGSRASLARLLLEPAESAAPAA